MAPHRARPYHQGMRKAERKEQAQRRAVDSRHCGDRYATYVEIEHRLEAEGVIEARSWLDDRVLRAEIQAAMDRASGNRHAKRS